MTPRQRVLTAIAHQESDRTPIQIYTTPEVEREIRAYFGDRDYMREFEVDFRFVSPAHIKPNKEPVPGQAERFYDEWGTGYSEVPNSAGGYYPEATDQPLGRLETMDEVENYAWPSPGDWDFSGIPAQIDQAGDHAVCYGHAGMPDIINGVGRGRGMERVLTDIITEDELGIAIIDHRVDYYYEWCRRGLEAGGGRIDILYLGEDLGCQNGPMMSPATFDSFFRPRIERFYRLGREYGCKVMMHSCGSTRRLQSRLIDMGLDVLDSVQPEPDEMDPEQLKAEFGDRLTYCGMISTQRTLPHGTVDDCRAEARHRLDVIGRGGGYIFCPAHCIQPDTPLQNVLAIYEEATGKRFM